MQDTDEPTLTHDDCISGHHENPCEGAVEYRMNLSGTGVPTIRCDKHWSERLDLEDRLRTDYPDSPHPPSWFDPTYAGESWDDD